MSNKKIQEINDKLLWFINGFIVLLEIIMTIGCIAASVFILARDVFNVDMKEFKGDNVVVLEVKELLSPEFEMLCRMVYAESGNQSLEVKRLVAATVLNRMESDKFPDSMEEVLTAPRQYGTVLTGKIWKYDLDEESIRACKLEINERSNKDVIYFSEVGYQNGKPWKKVGDLYFSK